MCARFYFSFCGVCDSVWTAEKKEMQQAFVVLSVCFVLSCSFFFTRVCAKDTRKMKKENLFCAGLFRKGASIDSKFANKHGWKVVWRGEKEECFLSFRKPFRYLYM